MKACDYHCLSCMCVCCFYRLESSDERQLSRWITHHSLTHSSLCQLL